MIKITLPDGSVREYEAGVTAYDVAMSISQGLAKAVLSAEVNGEVWDLTRPITKDFIIIMEESLMLQGLAGSC